MLCFSFSASYFLMLLCFMLFVQTCSSFHLSAFVFGTNRILRKIKFFKVSQSKTVYELYIKWNPSILMSARNKQTSHHLFAQVIVRQTQCRMLDCLENKVWNVRTCKVYKWKMKSWISVLFSLSEMNSSNCKNILYYSQIRMEKKYIKLSKHSGN